MREVCIVIPMYGQEKYTKKCIEITQKNSGVQCDIIIEDDGSENPFCNSMNYCDGVDVFRFNDNHGFTHAVNHGILYAQKHNYKYVMLLNNDTEPYPNFLKHLVDYMQANEDVGITGSIRIHPKKKVEKIAICGSDLIRGFQYFKEEDDLPPAPFECNIIPFASVLLRMDMVREIGLLDKRYRNHCSDTAYCAKAKMNGWKVVLVPESKVMHHLSVTTTANNIFVDDDQKKWLEVLAGLQYAQLMNKIPLDGEAGTYGQLEFSVVKR